RPRRLTRPPSRSPRRALLLSLLAPGLGLEPLQALLERAVRPAPVEERVALPPVDPHLARLVGRGDQEPELDGEELDVEQVDLDAGDDDALVEHALEDIRELRRRGTAPRPESRADAHVR